MPMVVMAARLPEEVLTAKDRTVSAGQRVAPVLLVGTCSFDADATTLAGTHSAGHRSLDGHLEFQVPRCGDGGDALHHRLRAAGVEGEPAAGVTVEECLKRLRDEAAVAERAIVGADDAGEAVAGEVGDVRPRFGWIGR